MVTEDFLKKLRNGDEKAFNTLFEKYKQKLISYAISLSGDPSLAKDIVQEVFMKIFEYRKKLKSDLSIQSFLYKSVYNQFITIYHKNKSLTKVHEEYYRILNQLMTSGDGLNENSDLIKMNICINKLPAKCKNVFISSKKEGLTNQEISEKFNISTKTVEGQITKAFKFLKRCMGIKFF